MSYNNVLAVFSIVGTIIGAISGLAVWVANRKEKCKKSIELLRQTLQKLENALAQTTQLKFYANRKGKHDRKNIRHLASEQMKMIETICDELYLNDKQICLLIKAAAKELNKLLIEDYEFNIKYINRYAAELEGIIKKIKMEISRLEKSVPFP